MKNLIAYRMPNIWTNLLSLFISITFMMAWLPFIRSIFDGKSYVWGISYFGATISGAGLSLSLLFIVAQVGLYAVLIIGLYRMKNRQLYGGLLAVWWINIFGNLIFDIIKNGDTMFHGDTMNVHISLTYIILPLAVGAILFIAMTLRTQQESVVISWNKKNSTLLYTFLAMLPILLILLSSGEPHGTSDQIGVLIAIAQCFYIPVIFRPFGHTTSSQIILSN
jgi:hypothetical protein